MKLLEIRPALAGSSPDSGTDLRIISILQNLGVLFVKQLQDCDFDRTNVVLTEFYHLADFSENNVVTHEGTTTGGVGRTTGILDLEPKDYLDDTRLLVKLSRSIAEALKIYFRKWDKPIGLVEEALVKVTSGDYFVQTGREIDVPGGKGKIRIAQKTVFSKHIYRFDLVADGEVFSCQTPELDIWYARELPVEERNDISVILGKMHYLKFGDWTDGTTLNFSYGPRYFQYNVVAGSIHAILPSSDK